MKIRSVVAGAANVARGWLKQVGATLQIGRMRRRKIIARPNGVLPRAPIMRAGRVALRAHNDNGGTAAVRFARVSLGPLIGAYGATSWHVASIGLSRAATASSR